MFKKKTTKSNSHRKSDRVLQLKVSSPRILLFQSFRAMKGLIQAVLLLGLVSYLGWLGVSAVQKHFVYNDEYLIQQIDLETNGYMTHEDLMEVSGITMNSTIFSVDLQGAQAKLLALPEVISVEMAREMPSTVRVVMEERVPVAWLASGSLGLAGRNSYGGMLVDEHGVMFLCAGRLWDVAKDLPVIEVFDALSQDFELGEPMTHADALRALSFINLVRKEGVDLSIERLLVENFYSLRIRTLNSMEARIGMYEHEEALDRLRRVMAHAESSGRELQWIDLLPRHNVPGFYKGSGLLPPPLVYDSVEVSADSRQIQQ